MAEPQLKEVKPFMAVTDSFTGSYNRTSMVLDDLMAWLLQTGHPYSGPPVAIYYDDPARVAEDKLRAEVCLPVDEALEQTAGYERKQIDGGRFASLLHSGPYSGIPEVYERLFEWMKENALEYEEGAGTREIFHRIMGEVESADDLLTEILVPVAGGGQGTEKPNPENPEK